MRSAPAGWVFLGPPRLGCRFLLPAGHRSRPRPRPIAGRALDHQRQLHRQPEVLGEGRLDIPPDGLATLAVGVVGQTEHGLAVLRADEPPGLEQRLGLGAQTSEDVVAPGLDQLVAGREPPTRIRRGLGAGRRRRQLPGWLRRRSGGIRRGGGGGRRCRLASHRPQRLAGRGRAGGGRWRQRRRIRRRRWGRRRGAAGGGGGRGWKRAAGPGLAILPLEPFDPDQHRLG